MKTPDQAKEEQFSLRETDLEILRDIVNKIHSIVENRKITQDVAFDLYSLSNDMSGMAERFVRKLLSLAKQNYQID